MWLAVMKLVFGVCNGLVWALFVFLGWRMGLIVFESFRRRRELRALARETRGLRQQADDFLKPRSKDAALSQPQCQFAVLQDARDFWQRLRSRKLAKVLPPMLSAILAGRNDSAAELVDQFLTEQSARMDLELPFAELSVKNGLFGTVLGILQAFLTANGQTLPLGALGFALVTTAVGLVLAAAIEGALLLIFKPSWNDLNDELEESRNRWICLWCERSQWLSAEALPPHEIEKAVRPVRAVRKTSARNAVCGAVPIDGVIKLSLGAEVDA